MEDPVDQVQESTTLLNSCNVVLIHPDPNDRQDSYCTSTKRDKMCSVDKLRLNFLEEELKVCTSRLASYERSTCFILAQLQLINSWIESTFETSSLIDTKCTTYQNWIKTFNLTKINSIAHAIKCKPLQEPRNVNPQFSPTASDSIDNVDEREPGLFIKVEPQEPDRIVDQEYQYNDLPLNNVDSEFMAMYDNDEERPESPEEWEHAPNTHKGRKRSSLWNHFITSKDPHNKNKIVSNVCKACGRQVSAEVLRLRNHLAKCRKKQREGLVVPPGIESCIENPESSGEGGGVGRPRCIYWAYFNTIRHPTNKRILSNKCKTCNKSVYPESLRLKIHLAKCIGLRPVEDTVEQPKISKAALKEKLAQYFITKPRNLTELEASAESNLKRRDATISICVKCGASVRSGVDSMINHLLGCDPGVGEEYKGFLRVRDKKGTQCEECGKVIVSDINRHMQSHSEVRPNSCGTCGKSFRRKSQLKLHILTVHKGVKIPRTKRPRQEASYNNNNINT